MRDPKEARNLVALALGGLIGREFRAEGLLERLIEELEKRLKETSGDCRILLSGSSFSVSRGRVDRVYSAEVVVRCGEQLVFSKIYLESVNYVRVTSIRAE
jgi:benzoyl-CoA reductase/2-hydroxyglutaryl-CoA dehydratase subunit BcrC/BadD/HgdB